VTIRLLPSRLGRVSRASTSREMTAAAILLMFALAAIIWANSRWAGTYSTFWNTQVGLSFGNAHAALTVRQLINSALMSLFFFTVGLEVKGQLTIGELTDRARAVVPLIAAVAGLTLPALIFLAFNHTGDNARAWGVVISTDTAFLLGALAVIAPKYPMRLRTFLMTLSIVDDVGALLVIALFYANRLRVAALLVAFVLIVLLVLVRYLPAARGPAYAGLAFCLWLVLQFGGIHPTLAGVAVALAIPAFTPERRRVEQVVDLIRAFRQSPNSDYARAAARSLREALSINERLQTAFAPCVSFVVLPVFALANAGVRLDRETVSAALRSPLTLGIVIGLVAGKFVGITGATAIVHYLGIGRLSPGLTLRRVAGGAALCGIGFTIALYIVDLAIADPARADQARVGVLVASVVSFVLGWATFSITDRLSPPKPVGAFLVRPVDPERDHIRGNPDAPLTLVEYADFECPFCSRATGSIDEVLARFGDELCYVWRHLPLERVHPHAMDAARAAEAAGLQGRFFDFGQVMFENQDNLGWEDIYRYANDIGLDLEQFDDDVRSSAVRHRVEDDAQDAEVMDLNSTPTFFIGGRRHKGPFDAATLIRALEESRDVSSTR
jgi:Na+/H+ antiporter NhaA